MRPSLLRRPGWASAELASPHPHHRL